MPILLGDCRDILPTLPAESVDLIVTSPPYADQRGYDYGGIKPENYVEWFLPISQELFRALKPTGSFVLNIKEKVVDGERSTYVLELILALKKQGWLWTEEYCWHKKNSYPGYWPNRLRDAWERLLHFTKQKRFAMYQDQVKQPIGDWAEDRLNRLRGNDFSRREPNTNSTFGVNMSAWANRETVLPDNVLYLPTESHNRNHSAVYPIQLPTFFIKLFTQPGDLVLDPFVGSGTTALAASQLNRNYIGIELNEEFWRVASERVLFAQPCLF